MCELACGDANVSQVPRGGGAATPQQGASGRRRGGRGGADQQRQTAGTGFCVRFLFVLAKESCGSSWCFRLFPQAVIHDGQLYLWRREQHFRTASVDQCLRAQTWKQLSPVECGAFYQMEHTLSDAKVYWTSAPPGSPAKQPGRIKIKAFWFAEKGNCSN